jgi:hypothetical protein
MGIQCRCGRFLSHVYAVTSVEGESYGRHELIIDVRGCCSRCGPEVEAAPGPWWDADTWIFRERDEDAIAEEAGVVSETGHLCPGCDLTCKRPCNWVCRCPECEPPREAS